MNPYRILIVDDNRNNIFTLKQVISTIEGCEIVEALSGEQALIATIEHEIHLILLDVQMPGMDGFETARHLQMAEMTRDIPIIFVTAVFKAEEFMQQGYALGAVDYVTKPIDTSRLLNSVHLYRKLFGREQELKTTLRNLQEKEALLIHQSRLAAMGQMLGAIAHQWRQPLNILALSLIDLKESYAYGELTSDYLANIVKTSMEQIQYMSKTIDDFRNFFKPDKHKIPFNIVEVVKEALNIVHVQLENHFIQSCIEYNCNKPEKGGNIILYGYPGELKQVLLNIINNAMDAIVTRQEADKSFKGLIVIKMLHDEHKMTIRIEDNGGGIPEKVFSNIFEPYFTTKLYSKGTGIGLYMAKTIIEEHMGGRLYAENNNDGASFVIELFLNKSIMYHEDTSHEFKQ
ncbi:MAG TPA: hybrid sensor histidine kinase/response regulator [Thermodesulfovibrionia bacterium]|nr:hybrid sensor histidine kinase/response regulator [Thermodesulfovibrionia bacterium]